MKKGLILATACFTMSFFTPAYASTRNFPVLPTEAFINQYMLNSNGSVAAHLQGSSVSSPDLVSGREALSESLGLWMLDLVQRGDAKGFHQAYDTLLNDFMNSRGFVYWKIQPDGAKFVSSDALIDDYRIMDALSKAAQEWHNPSYNKTARTIAKALATNNDVNNLLVDFYDSTSNTAAPTLTTSYIDPAALSYMLHQGLISPVQYQANLNVLRNVPTRGVFYAKTYDIPSGTYQFAPVVNLIDQLYVGLHLSNLGVGRTPLYKFLKSQFYANGDKLYGQYDLETDKPAVSFECPAVYALAIQYAVKMHDAKFAKDLYSRLLQLRVNNPKSPYYGGYVFKQDTNVFNDLTAALAERTMISNGYLVKID